MNHFLKRLNSLFSELKPIQKNLLASFFHQRESANRNEFLRLRMTHPLMGVIASVSLLIGFTLIPGQGAESAVSKNPETAAALVVFNNGDPMSVDLAGYYAEKRGIPFDHLIGLDCPLTEEISRQVYEQTIENPLRKIMTQRGWWRIEEIGDHSIVMENKIRFVALIRGIPLKIAPDPVAPGKPAKKSVLDSKDEAAVDSELAAIGFFIRNHYGPVKNPYYRSYTPMLELNQPDLMLVCRLDAADPLTVKQMINDSIEAEKTGLWGMSYVDARGINEEAVRQGDAWLFNLARSELHHGIPVVLDRAPSMFSKDYPMKSTAFYYGWYSDNIEGPFERDDFQFVKGAVACHIHSFSAASLRDPHRYWVAPLLAKGVVATMGNVYEPFLAFTPTLDVFDDRLRAGFNFAESAYQSEPALSWMTTFVGDPLYRPFRSKWEVNGDARNDNSTEWSAYQKGALVWFEKSHAEGAAQLQKLGEALHSGIIFEGLGLLQIEGGDGAAAHEAFLKARKFYARNEDALRTLIHELLFLKGTGKTQAALKIAREGIKFYPTIPATSVLRSLETEMAPPPTK